MYLCEGQKWDLEYEVAKRDFEVLPPAMNMLDSHQPPPQLQQQQQKQLHIKLIATHLIHLLVWYSCTFSASWFFWMEKVTNIVILDFLLTLQQEV